MDYSPFEEIFNSIEKNRSSIEEYKLLANECKSRINSIKEILSIEKDKSPASLDKHKSYIKERNLSYNDLLDYAALNSSMCDLIEFENENLKKLLDVYEEISSLEKKLFSLKDTAYIQKIDIMELLKLASNRLQFLEGQLAGGDAQKRIMAKKGSDAKNESDPKQAEKEFVRSCWMDWQEKPDSYKSKAAFARDMLDKCEHLVSTKKIEDWCRMWEAENTNRAS